MKNKTTQVRFLDLVGNFYSGITLRDQQADDDCINASSGYGLMDSFQGDMLAIAGGDFIAESGAEKDLVCTCQDQSFPFSGFSSGSDMSSDTFQGIGKEQVERVFFPAQPVL